jgi:hypothetical protein
MVGDISEVFRRIGNPAGIFVVIHPSALAVGHPIGFHLRRLPEVAILVLIINSLPTALFFKHIGLILDLLGKVSHRVSPDFHAFRPQRIPLKIPGIPGFINSCLTRAHLSGIGQKRCLPRYHFITGITGDMHEIDITLDGNDLNRLISHVKVKDGLRRGHYIAEW